MYKKNEDRDDIDKVKLYFVSNLNINPHLQDSKSIDIYSKDLSKNEILNKKRDIKGSKNIGGIKFSNMINNEKLNGKLMGGEYLELTNPTVPDRVVYDPLWEQRRYSSSKKNIMGQRIYIANPNYSNSNIDVNNYINQLLKIKEGDEIIISFGIYDKDLESHSNNDVIQKIKETRTHVLTKVLKLNNWPTNNKFTFHPYSCEFNDNKDNIMAGNCINPSIETFPIKEIINKDKAKTYFVMSNDDILLDIYPPTISKYTRAIEKRCFHGNNVKLGEENIICNTNTCGYENDEQNFEKQIGGGIPSKNDNEFKDGKYRKAHNWSYLKTDFERGDKYCINNKDICYNGS